MIRYIIPIFFLLLGLEGFAQTSEQGGKYVFVKFDSYSIKENETIQKQLSQEKVIYTCIPSGIVVVEVLKTDSTAENRIAGEIKRVTEFPSFRFVQEMTLIDAEISCSTFRKPD